MYGEHPGFIARFMQRFQPTPMQVVQAELKDAKLAALMSQSEAEYAALRVKIHSITSDYHLVRADRLQAYVDDQTKQKTRDDSYISSVFADHSPGD